MKKVLGSILVILCCAIIILSISLIWIPIESTIFTIILRIDFTLLVLCSVTGIITNDKKLNK